mmetsp:Transcript_61081/g.122470  ORF Transcript_61081/g.122470 Transcript_61081/m.122470 type:complete len:290 (+) Transcript_61081:69-938(+)|eukprot:CAMPEP_0171685020 /NCGR_PEP_ID=MMETSP0991-20121206/2017_1 /TAXON_ID=483369 /ORGANISM="non described non described, Strain CCMP2098" /LENGTH=289 /DNA_ID=CAMNT_0012272623 /DNA_START=29 /DNA_END=898 /DNA_ORIENTATION=-
MAACSTIPESAAKSRAWYYVGPIDGKVGPDTSQACQKWLVNQGENPGPVDSYFGNLTAAAFQRFLEKQGEKYNPGLIDGKFRDGRKSTTAFQHWLTDQGYNPGPTDGRWGSLTVCALQRFLEGGGVHKFSGKGKSVTLRPHLEFMYGFDNSSKASIKQKQINVEGFTSAKGTSSSTEDTKSLSAEVSGNYGFPTGFQVEAKVSGSMSRESSWGSTNSTSLSTTRTTEIEVTFPGETQTEYYGWALKLAGGHVISLPGSTVVLTNGKSRTGETKDQLEAGGFDAILKPMD